MISFIDESYRGNELKGKISQMDVVVCTAPLTKNTNKIFNKSLLAKMKDQKYFS